jgi:hypothetical protein
MNEERTNSLGPQLRAVGKDLSRHPSDLCSRSAGIAGRCESTFFGAAESCQQGEIVQMIAVTGHWIDP